MAKMFLFLKITCVICEEKQTVYAHINAEYHTKEKARKCLCHAALVELIRHLN